MKNTLKKLIALMLSLVMILTCVPANIVKAVEPPDTFTVKNAYAGGNVSDLVIECNGTRFTGYSVACDGVTPTKFENGKTYRIYADSLPGVNHNMAVNAVTVVADASSKLDNVPLDLTYNGGGGTNTFFKAITGQITFDFNITITDTRITITFDKNGGKDGFAGKFDGTKVILGDAFDKQYMSEYMTFESKFNSIYSTGDAPNGPNIYGATVDFKNIKTNEDAKELVGTGFSVTCNTCYGFVCIKFIDGTDVFLNHVDGIEWNDTCSEHNDRSVVLEIGVEDCNNGQDIVKKIMDNAIFINTKLAALSAKTIDEFTFEYGLNYRMTKDDVVNTVRPEQEIKCLDDNKNYIFTGSWVFEKEGNGKTHLVKKIERHYVLLGAEIISKNPNVYGTKLIISDPRNDGAADKSPVNGLYKKAVREGIYYKALLNSIKVDKTFNESVFPENPFFSPDGNQVFVGWTTTRDEESTLITLEDITENADLTVYALWAPLEVVEQPSQANGYKYKTNINEKWSQKNKLVCEVYMKNEEGSFDKVDSLSQSGTYKYKLTYGTSSVFTDEFEYVKPSSKTYKASDDKNTAEKISGSGKKGSTRTITPEEGRKVTDVIVKDKDGNIVEVTMNDDGTYSFKQPASNVTVEVLYEALTPEEEMQRELMKDDIKVADSNEGESINPNAKFIKGYDDGTFKPNNEVSNLELMCMVTQLFEDTSKLDAKEEIDLNQGDNEWAGNVIALANGLGLVPGNKNDKNYNLNNNVTRADLAVVVYNLIKDYSPSAKLEDRENCSDAIGKPYADAVAKLVELGVLKGYDDGLFHGENTLTRAEAVVVINRALRSLGFEIKVGNIQKSFPDLTKDHWAYNEIMFAANK